MSKSKSIQMHTMKVNVEDETIHYLNNPIFRITNFIHMQTSVQYGMGIEKQELMHFIASSCLKKNLGHMDIIEMVHQSIVQPLHHLKQ